MFVFVRLSPCAQLWYFRGAEFPTVPGAYASALFREPQNRSREVGLAEQRSWHDHHLLKFSSVQ